MMPHLGVLSTVHSKAALEIFEKDCLVMLGTCITSRDTLKEEDYGKKVADITIKIENGSIIKEELTYGTIKKIPLAVGKTAQIEIFHRSRGISRKLEAEVNGGVVGIILDGRGRPITLPKKRDDRIKKLIEWFTAMELYPKELLKI
jgi:hypothetical protein